MPFEYAPASNLTPLNSGSAIASPAATVPIAEVAIPRATSVSPRVPFTMVDEIRVGGATPVTAQRIYANPVGIGDTVYEPMSGDFSARPRPSEAPRLNPVNQGTATATSPRTATAGTPINPRIPRPSAAGLVRGGVSMGVGVAVEVVAHAAFNAAFPGATERARAYEAKNADPRSARPTRGETIAAGSALGLGGAGLAGFGAVAATRYLLPDDVDPGNPNGLIGRILGWDEDYPSQTNPDAMGQGPTLDPGQPAPFTGGQTVGVTYRVNVVYRDEYRNLTTDPWTPRAFASWANVRGPVRGLNPAQTFLLQVMGTNPDGSIEYKNTGLAGPPYSCGSSPNNFRNCQVVITSVVRTDGQPDTGGNPPPVASPVIAPNPARTRPPNPDGTQPQLPAPPVPLAPVPTPENPVTDWPYTPPLATPGTTPLAPPLATPANFSPTAPIGEPNPPTNPNAPPGPPDLDPNAPRRAAPDLATDPDTPPAPAGGLAPVNGANENESGEPFNGWIVNNQRQYGNSPIAWGPPIVKGDSGWTRDGQPLSDEQVSEALQPYGGQQAIDRALDRAPLGTQITRTPSGVRVDRPGQEIITLQGASFPVPPAVVPVPIPVGGSQPVTTPSNPLSPNNNPNVRVVQQPVTQTPTEGPRGSCFYEFQRVADIQRKATEVNDQAKNPTSGFTGLYGIGIESRVKIGESFTLLQQVNQFMRKAWEMTRMQKVLDVLTFIGVMHNVGMLSRDVGETFFQLISQGVQAVGIRDEEDNVIDVGQVVGNSVENLLKGILGEDVYNGIGTAWNKANRIISSASAIIWTVRSIADSSLDLMEWIGENTGRIGNALKRWGVVGERSYPWMSESARAQSRFRNRFSKVTDALENTEDRISVFTQATSNVIEIQEETQELGENWGRFRDSIEDGIPDPWADNNPVKDGYDASKAISDGPDVPPSEAQKG